MIEHIDDLAARGASVDGQSATMVLDLRVQPGGAADAADLIEYGKEFGIEVIVSEYR